MVKNTLFNYAVMRGDRSVLVPLPLFKKCCTSGHNYFFTFIIIFLHLQLFFYIARSEWSEQPPGERAQHRAQRRHHLLQLQLGHGRQKVDTDRQYSSSILTLILFQYTISEEARSLLLAIV